jgi:hypothetical protein
MCDALFQIIPNYQESVPRRGMALRFVRWSTNRIFHHFPIAGCLAVYKCRRSSHLGFARGSLGSFYTAIVRRPALLAFDSTQSYGADATASLTQTEDPVRLVALANRYSRDQVQVCETCSLVSPST